MKHDRYCSTSNRQQLPYIHTLHLLCSMNGVGQEAHELLANIYLLKPATANTHPVYRNNGYRTLTHSSSSTDFSLHTHNLTVTYLHRLHWCKAAAVQLTCRCINCPQRAGSGTPNDPPQLAPESNQHQPQTHQPCRFKCAGTRWCHAHETNKRVPTLQSHNLTILH
jgi:hypothetical protein